MNHGPQTTACAPAAAPAMAFPHGKGRPRAGSAPQRRRQLLDTALTLFAERGLSELTLAEIARRAHVALRTIYLQYGGKSGLVRALIDDIGRQHRAELDALHLDDQPFDGQLSGLALHLARRMAHPWLPRLYASVAASNDDMLVDAFEQAGPGQVKDALHRALMAAQAEGMLRAGHPVDALCEHFMACIAGSRTAPTRADDVGPRATRGLAFFIAVLDRN